MSPTIRSWLATSVFALAGIIAVLFYSIVSPFLLPHFIIYMVLVINTFFSIRFWAAHQPNDIRQFLIDAVLVVAYLTLAFSIGEPLHFAIVSLGVFIAATIKYVLMRGRTPHEALVEHKTFLDALGAIACAALLGGTLSGYALETAWIFAIGFSLANVHLLFVRPMYQLQ